jgi:hypothetical protein
LGLGAWGGCRLLRTELDPKRFAASLRLDHNSLYEEGAVEASRAGKHLKALELYMLAKSPYKRVIPTLVKSKQMAFAGYYLGKALADPAALTAAARKGLSDMLLCCYVEQLCHADTGEQQLPDEEGEQHPHPHPHPHRPPHGGSDEDPAGVGAAAAAGGGLWPVGEFDPAPDLPVAGEEKGLADFLRRTGQFGGAAAGMFAPIIGRALGPTPAGSRRGSRAGSRANSRPPSPGALAEPCESAEQLYLVLVKFIGDNWDYNVAHALALLLSYGLFELYLHVAIARQQVEPSLDQAIAEGAVGLRGPARQLLHSRGYGELLCTYAGGAFLHCMPPAVQVRYLTEQPSVGLCLRVARPLIADLDVGSLEALARFLDPARPGVWATIAGQRPTSRVKTTTPDRKRCVGRVVVWLRR